MRIISRFRFDHEVGDTPHQTARLREFKAMGIELGALVTVWYCTPCDFAEADFTYTEGSR